MYRALVKLVWIKYGHTSPSIDKTRGKAHMIWAWHKKIQKFLLLWFLLAMIVLVGQGVVYAQDPPDPSLTIANISSPLNGGFISGEVPIRGSAAHPTAFNYYELEYANLANQSPIWLPIGGRVSQQVPNDGILGIWDTIGGDIADGLYQIRLRVFLDDPEIEPITVTVTNLQLGNTPPTALPSVAPDLSSDTTSEAPEIELPPTTAPRPTVETLADTSITSNSSRAGEDGGDTAINFGRLQSAFCTGSIVSLVFFGLLLAYLGMRARLRPLTRQLMWQIRNEMKDEDKDR